MRYLVLSHPSEDYAAAMSRALYALSAPPGTTTRYAVGWVTDAEGRVALDLGDTGQYLQPTADIEGFVELLPISEAERAGLVQHLTAARGTRLRYADMLPDSLRAGLTGSFEAAS